MHGYLYPDGYGGLAFGSGNIPSVLVRLKAHRRAESLSPRSEDKGGRGLGLSRSFQITMHARLPLASL
jgi:hypothetical protein